MANAEIGEVKLEPKTTLTPPASEEADKHDESSDLSEIEGDLELDDMGEIEPDHYYEGGKIPVFKPVSTIRHCRSKAFSLRQWLHHCD